MTLSTAMVVLFTSVITALPAVSTLQNKNAAALTARYVLFISSQPTSLTPDRQDCHLEFQCCGWDDTKCYPMKQDLGHCN